MHLLFKLDLELSMLGFFTFFGCWPWLEQISSMSLCDLHASHLNEHVFSKSQTGCHCCFAAVVSIGCTWQQSRLSG